MKDEGGRKSWLADGDWPSADDIQRSLPGDKRPEDWLSGMDKFLFAVRRGTRNVRLFVEIKPHGTQFQAVILAVASVNGKMYTAEFMTSVLSIGMDDQQAERDADIVRKAVVHSLADAVFLGDKSGVDDDGYSGELAKSGMVFRAGSHPRKAW